MHIWTCMETVLESFHVIGFISWYQGLSPISCCNSRTRALLRLSARKLQIWQRTPMVISWLGSKGGPREACPWFMAFFCCLCLNLVWFYSCKSFNQSISRCRLWLVLVGPSCLLCGTCVQKLCTCLDTLQIPLATSPRVQNVVYVCVMICQGPKDLWFCWRTASWLHN